MKMPGSRPGFFAASDFKFCLKFLVKIAHRAGDIHSAGHAALAVLDALDDARGFAAFRTVGRLRRVHYLLAVTCFGNLGHDFECFSSVGMSLLTWVLNFTRGFNGAVANYSLAST